MFADRYVHHMGDLLVYTYQAEARNHVFTQKGVTTMDAKEWTKVDVEFDVKKSAGPFGVSGTF